MMKTSAAPAAPAAPHSSLLEPALLHPALPCSTLPLLYNPISPGLPPLVHCQMWWLLLLPALPRSAVRQLCHFIDPGLRLLVPSPMVWFPPPLGPRSSTGGFHQRRQPPSVSHLGCIIPPHTPSRHECRSPRRCRWAWHHQRSVAFPLKHQKGNWCISTHLFYAWPSLCLTLPH